MEKVLDVPISRLKIESDEIVVVMLPRGEFMSDSQKRALLEGVGIPRDRALVLQNGASIASIRLDAELVKSRTESMLRNEILVLRRAIATSAIPALLSYAHGNSSPVLAEEILDALREVLIAGSSVKEESAEPE